MTMPAGGALPPLPPGIANPSSNPGNSPGSDPTPALTQASKTFSPPFQLGKGKPGVYTDPRLQIAGGGNAPTSTTVSPTSPGATTAPPAGNIGGSGALNGGGDSSNSSPIPTPSQGQ